MARLGDDRKLEISVLPMELQEWFMAFVDQIDKSKSYDNLEVAV